MLEAAARSSGGTLQAEAIAANPVALLQSLGIGGDGPGAGRDGGAFCAEGGGNEFKGGEGPATSSLLLVAPPPSASLSAAHTPPPLVLLCGGGGGALHAVDAESGSRLRTPAADAVAGCLTGTRLVCCA